MAVGVEISEQVRARQVLERSQAEREKLLQKLEAASRAKDEFLAMLGHELRNPLAPIATALQLMTLRGGETASASSTIIERQVDHLTRLVDDLLDVSRITRGKIELKAPAGRAPATSSPSAVEIASPTCSNSAHHLIVEVCERGGCR